MWFDNWESIIRILVHGTLGYVALVFILRVSGKRSLSKMNAFDFVITIALGSVFASLVLLDNVPLVNGVVAIALLIGLQWVVSALYVRSKRFEQIVKGTPQLLFWKGTYLDDVLRRVRVTHEEIQAAMRDQGQVEAAGSAAVLETDGTITVMEAPGDSIGDALSNVRGRPD